MGRNTTTRNHKVLVGIIYVLVATIDQGGRNVTLLEIILGVWAVVATVLLGLVIHELRNDMDRVWKRD